MKIWTKSKITIWSLKTFCAPYNQSLQRTHGIFVASGILFNHESPRRGETFVTRKITMFLAKYLKDKKGVLRLGNIYSKRDWVMQKICWNAMENITTKKPDDYIISTDNTYSNKEFINMSCKILGIKLFGRERD